MLLAGEVKLLLLTIEDKTEYESDLPPLTIELLY
jgi:hypothetical protein